jgi:hypothetical protein
VVPVVLPDKFSCRTGSTPPHDISRCHNECPNIPLRLRFPSCPSLAKFYERFPSLSKPDAKDLFVADLEKDADIAGNFELWRLTVKPNHWPEMKV